MCSIQMKIIPILLLILGCEIAQADPQLTSWYTDDSGQYARVYQSVADETSRTVSKTWSRGSGFQNTPTYAGVSKIVHSTNWVYIRTTGLASHIMGPWYLDAAKSANFPNFPSNTAKIYRIPRTPTIPTTKLLTGLGASGCMVNGVSMFDMRDAFSYVNASATDSTPVNGLTGDGVWNRDGYHNEGVTFDAALAHQAGNNYHYHAQPIGLRYQLGDHVDYNATTNRYTESTSAVAKHSPILAWAADGLPVYGPYGYSSPLNANSGVRRMVSGFVLRNGSFGTTNLNTTGRTTLPSWAQRIQTVTFKNGPAINGTYLLGHYIEDFDYLGDRGYTQGVDFDLNEQNVRWCVTPEYPSGTYAYFTTINADGTPAYPYTTGRQYYGNPTGGISTIAETVTTYFNGGPNKVETANAPIVNNATGDVTMTWSAVEGGTYLVEASDDLTVWPDLTPTVTAADDLASVVELGAKNSHPKRFYRVSKTALASFDSNGFDYTPTGGGTTTVTAPGGTVTRGSTYTLTINIPTNSTPPVPPANVAVNSVTVGGSATGISALVHSSQYVVTCNFVVPAGITTGAKAVVVNINNKIYTLTGALTVN
jgi:hypothetical protein